MLQKSRELTKKLEAGSDDESDDETTPTTISQTGGDTHYSTPVSSNPWMVKPTAAAERSKFSRPAEVTSKDTQESSEEEQNDDMENGSNVSDDNDREADTNMRTSKKQQVVLATKAVTSECDVNQEDSGSDMNDDNKKNEIDAIFETTANKSQQRTSAKSKQKKKIKQKNVGKKEKLIRKDLKRKKRTTVTKKTLDESENEGDDSSDDEDNQDSLISEGLVRKRTLEEINEGLAEEETSPKKRKRTPNKKHKVTEKKIEPVKEAYIDPNKLFTMDTKLKQVGKGPTLVGKYYSFL